MTGERRCEYCDEPLDPGKRRHARHCDASCRSAARFLRQQEADRAHESVESEKACESVQEGQSADATDHLPPPDAFWGGLHRIARVPREQLALWPGDRT